MRIADMKDEVRCGNFEEVLKWYAQKFSKGEICQVPFEVVKEAARSAKASVKTKGSSVVVEFPHGSIITFKFDRKSKCCKVRCAPTIWGWTAALGYVYQLTHKLECQSYSSDDAYHVGEFCAQLFKGERTPTLFIPFSSWARMTPGKGEWIITPSAEGDDCYVATYRLREEP